MDYDAPKVAPEGGGMFESSYTTPGNSLEVFRLVHVFSRFWFCFSLCSLSLSLSLSYSLFLSLSLTLCFSGPSGKYHAFHHCEFWVGNSKQAAAFYCARFGFNKIAYRGLETGSREVATYVVGQGDIRFSFSSAITPKDPKKIGARVAVRGDGVKVVAFSVDNCKVDSTGNALLWCVVLLVLFFSFSFLSVECVALSLFSFSFSFSYIVVSLVCVQLHL
jgi:Glyoxalase/Bleomycin resistance protein/Dioxygenase superfamily